MSAEHFVRVAVNKQPVLLLLLSPHCCECRRAPAEAWAGVRGLECCYRGRRGAGARGQHATAARLATIAPPAAAGIDGEARLSALSAQQRRRPRDAQLMQARLRPTTAALHPPASSSSSTAGWLPAARAQLSGVCPEASAKYGYGCRQRSDAKARHLTAKTRSTHCRPPELGQERALGSLAACWAASLPNPQGGAAAAHRCFRLKGKRRERWGKGGEMGWWTSHERRERTYLGLES